MPTANTNTMANEVEPNPVDPWEQAFAALNKEEQKDSSPAVPEQGGNGTTAAATDTSADTANVDGGEETTGDAQPGGFDLSNGDNGESDETDNSDDFSISEEELEEYRNAALEEVTNQAINDVAKAYIKQGARNKNGVLGATIDDKDICKRDDDGVPHFYNPDTGREFTGDNPRRQAQEWVDDYNASLAQAFNNTCKGYSEKLMEQREPQFATLAFAGTYEKLDPVRQIMFDQFISGHEVYDSDGDLVGYNCDLNLALNRVNDMVRNMQNLYRGQHAQSDTAQAQQATGPALDMKASGGDNSSKPPRFNSIAEAMEWQQDQLLAKMKQPR